MNDSSPPPDTNLAPGFLIPCGVLVVISACLCVARILTRIRPSPHLHRDDYLISIAMVLSFFGYICTCISAAHGWGHRSPYVAQRDKTIAFQALFATQFLWIFATALVRISVAVSLLRLGRCAGEGERLWKWCLRSIFVVQFFISAGWVVLLFFNCHPLRGMWEPVPKLTCWPHKHTVNYGWVANPIIITVDFILATMPIQLIRMLQRTLREKILICILMATGLVATGCAAYKMTLSQQANQGDLLSTTVKLSLWCKLEEQIGIIAACLPCLKAQMEKLLCQMGILEQRLSTLVVSINPVRFGLSPSEFPRAPISSQATSDMNRNESDASSMSFATRPDWTRGTAKSGTTSSQTREAEP